MLEKQKFRFKEVKKMTVIKDAAYNVKDYLSCESGCYADCSCDSDTLLPEDCTQG